MNYRHAFHAGNFADVHKHAALTLVLDHLRQKATPFRVIDTHAGAGVYDLGGPEAGRTGEWRDGIGRLIGDAAGSRTAPPALLIPYLNAVRAVNDGCLRRYPGSPAIARQWLRPQDRLIACELQPDALRLLGLDLGRDARAKAIAIDGWRALTAYVPPKERRGVVLIDPPYEDADETARLVKATAQAWRKWQTGIFLIWYPIKAGAENGEISERLEKSIASPLLRSHLVVGATRRAPNSLATTPPLAGSGLIVVNPPWRMAEQLRVIGDFLATALCRGSSCGSEVFWIREPV